MSTPKAPRHDVIAIRGAAQHNLRDVDLDVPKGKLVVFSGVSGSGKSSLAFDTLYAEGQRRYVESLSSYARQFLGQMDKPAYDHISGLSPTIAIEQKTAGSNPRSTVGTITEIHDHLRVLFARAGVQRCHGCGKPIERLDVASIVGALTKLPEGTRLMLLAPVRRGAEQDPRLLVLEALRLGFVRARVGDDIVELDADTTLPDDTDIAVAWVIDRVVVRPDKRDRLHDSVETALRHGEGRVQAEVMPRPGEDTTALPWIRRTFAEQPLCCDGLTYPEPTPQLFSFNGPQGACPTCNGLGIAMQVDAAKVVPDPTLSLNAGAVAPWGAIEKSSTWQARIVRAAADVHGFDLDRPWAALTATQRALVLHGAEDKVPVRIDGKGREGTWEMKFEGVIPQLARRWRETSSEAMRKQYQRYFVEQRCTDCGGSRLRPEARAVTVGDRSIDALAAMPVAPLLGWFDTLQLEGEAATIAPPLLREIRHRLRFLVDVGLEYLTLARGGQTLSGGESQRIRLASQLGSELSGVLYVLDEPSIGLHTRDAARLVRTLEHLRDLGNSVVVVEHDETTLRAADHIVDFGPGAGREGGTIVAAGTVGELEGHATSLTGAYLAGRRRIEVPRRRRPGDGALVVRGARHHNLRSVDVSLPLGCMTVVTGVSGAGKSSLVQGIVLPALRNALHGAQRPVGEHDGFDGVELLDKVIAVDQRPIGRSPRSTPATYTKLWDGVRDLFASLPESQVAGFGPGRFSFNVKGGRCEHCKGDGQLKVEMHFLADVYVRCDVCDGRRFNDNTLTVRYKGASIADVLQMRIDEAAEHFAHIPNVRAGLQTLQRVGLGYLSLGQTAPTLSGGEAQRVKLSRELARPGSGRTLYVLDEPSTGLHFEDVRRLLGVLEALVDAGNSVLVVEHDLDIIKVADHVVDVGPNGGDGGGRVVATGTPEQVATVSESHTGAALRRVLS